MARFGLGATPPPPDSGNQVEYIAWFRFPVTFTYLDSAPAVAAPALPIKPSATSLAPAAPAMTLVSAAPVAPAPVISGDASSAATAQWEMVIPKMTRPPARPVVERLPAPPAPALPVPTTPAKERASAEYVPPSLLQVAPDQPFLARYWRQIALGGVAILALGLLLWGNSGGGASANKPSAEWSHRYTSPPGRLLSLYEPSRGESDYSVEFGWVPDAKGAGLVLRVRDENNYYATRLLLQQPAPNLELAEEHFTVVGGVEGTHSRKIISLANPAGPLQIQMDAIGSAFTLSVQGHPVDYWNDAQFNSGALGFFDESGERPEVRGLHVTLIKKGATRTAVVSLP
ncbi:MAG TPA: hypothetical protein VLM42_19450 [Bryobacteraceae bacterium]|nr:hypothetical protein [Bryobacteraceae bacterium]